MQDVYKVKRVPFGARQDVPVLMQNLNGPCPLLAIANVLSLRDELSIPSSHTEISNSQLISLVAEKVLEARPSSSSMRSAEFEANLRANIDDALRVLGKLGSPGNTGMDVNIRFDTPFGFEPTPEVAVFDLLGINLAHAWLVDPQDTVTAQALGSKTYNQAVELLISAFDSNPASFSSAHAPRLKEALSHTAAARAAEAALAANAAAAASAPPADGQADLLGLDVSEPAQKPPAQDGSTQPESSAAAGSAFATPLATEESQGAPSAAASAAPAAAAAATDDALGLFESLTLRDDAPPATPASAALATPATAAVPQGAPAGGQQAGLGTPAVSVARSQGSVVVRPSALEALAVQDFLENNATQATVYGLSQLHAGIPENTFAVFFRNNHFNCLFKHGRALYQLITDQGYLGVPEVVWERLDTLDGDTQLCGGDFLPHKAKAQIPATPQFDMNALNAAIPPGALEGLSEADAAAIAEAAGLLLPPSAAPDAAGLHHESQSASQHHHDHDADLALALQLQEEERAAAQEAQAREQARLAQQQQQQQGSQHHSSHHSSYNSSHHSGGYQQPYGGYQQQQQYGGYQQQQQQPQRTSAGQGRGGYGQQQGQQYTTTSGSQSVRMRPVQAPPEPKKEESSCAIM